VKKSKKIFISTTFANDDSKVSEVLLMCKRANLTNVELGSNHVYEKNFGKIINNYKFNFLVHNYFPIPKNSFVVNIASFSQNIRKLSLNHIKKAINFCLVSKAKLYTFHPGFIGDPIKASRKKKNYDFIWENKEVDKNYSLAFKNMINSLKKIVKFAKKKNVRIAIETEGSSKKKNNFSLMQKPEEYKKLFNYFKPDDLGINLNIGHLNLASKAFNFSRQEFVNMIKPYIVALELSHNNRKQDQHLPLEKNAWYWKIINDPDFKKIYKILEFRNTKLKKIKNTIRYF
jgi:sugar phosphate isomerase/epimerase